MTEKRKTYKSAALIYSLSAFLMLCMAALFSENFSNIVFMLVTFVFAALAGSMFGCAVMSGEFEKKEDDD